MYTTGLYNNGVKYEWGKETPPPKELCFTANTAGSTVQLQKNGSPTAVSLETSTNGRTWSDYTIGNTITLTNIGDKVYMRNKSETVTEFNKNTGNRYQFVMSGSISASGEINYLLCKNGTTTLSSDSCYNSLFLSCASLTTPPNLTATTLSNTCYYQMFSGCTNLTTLPLLPATTLKTYCYSNMFVDCSKIKLSATQTGEYQTAYIVPSSGTGISAEGALQYMFAGTGGTYAGTININTTYYTSNTVI